jgi:hypothetical protein
MTKDYNELIGKPIKIEFNVSCDEIEYIYGHDGGFQPFEPNEFIGNRYHRYLKALFLQCKKEKENKPNTK